MELRPISINHLFFEKLAIAPVFQPSNSLLVANGDSLDMRLSKKIVQRYHSLPWHDVEVRIWIHSVLSQLPPFISLILRDMPTSLRYNARYDETSIASAISEDGNWQPWDLDFPRQLGSRHAYLGGSSGTVVSGKFTDDFAYSITHHSLNRWSEVTASAR